MSIGEIDTTALIICVCVIIPAVVAISVCAILYFSHRNKDRKLHRQTNRSSLYEYDSSHERQAQDAYIIDFTRTNRSQQQRRPRGPPPVFEQSPPAYDTTIIPTRRQPASFYLPVRTGPYSKTARQSPSTITPSIHSIMPPSYAEIFLTPHTLSDE
ncbi:hypothetical protein I4U23_018515 [Adineta vaga]|nr:hypothetical protein I4U23_018515 [Adineta vaga]